MTAPIGTAPFVSCFATLSISGVTPNSFAPVGDPTRPNAVMTSSKINKILFSSHIFLILFKYPTGGGITPAEPAIGSKITAAILLAS